MAQGSIQNAEEFDLNSAAEEMKLLSQQVDELNARLVALQRRMSKETGSPTPEELFVARALAQAYSEEAPTLRVIRGGR